MASSLNSSDDIPDSWEDIDIIPIQKTINEPLNLEVVPNLAESLSADELIYSTVLNETDMETYMLFRNMNVFTPVNIREYIDEQLSKQKKNSVVILPVLPAKESTNFNNKDYTFGTWAEGFEIGVSALTAGEKANGIDIKFTTTSTSNNGAASSNLTCKQIFFRACL
jgi:hypothetical protein